MRKWLRKLAPDHAAIEQNRWLYPFRNTLLHPRLWHMNRHSVAGGVAAGLFFGLMPAPFQMLGAALAAIVLRINLPIAILATLYTNPVTFWPLYLLAWWIGQFLVGGDANPAPPPEFALADFADLGAWLATATAWLGQVGLALVVGVLLLASTFSVLGYLFTRIAWKLHILHKLTQRKARRNKPAITRKLRRPPTTE